MSDETGDRDWNTHSAPPSRPRPDPDRSARRDDTHHGAAAWLLTTPTMGFLVVGLLANTDRWIETGVPAAVTVAIMGTAIAIGVIGGVVTAILGLRTREASRATAGRSSTPRS